MLENAAGSPQQDGGCLLFLNEWYSAIRGLNSSWKTVYASASGAYNPTPESRLAAPKNIISVSQQVFDYVLPDWMQSSKVEPIGVVISFNFSYVSFVKCFLTNDFELLFDIVL